MFSYRCNDMGKHPIISFAMHMSSDKQGNMTWFPLPILQCLERHSLALMEHIS
jgi:hypothetical protein